MTLTADIDRKLTGARTVFAFSGQGSQTYHMAKELYENEPVFRASMSRLNAMVVKRTGFSVVERVYEARRKRSDVFDDVRYTHPAIFMVELSLVEVLRRRGVEPDAVIGASLGEYGAAVVAGLIGLEDALGAVVAQAQIFHERCPNGGMLAILAPKEMYERLPILRNDTEIASFNYDGSFVVAGPRAALDAAQNHLSRMGVVSQVLPVRQAFHSAVMDPTEREVQDHTDRVVTAPPRLPFVSCTTGTVLYDLDRAYFWRLVRRPILVSKGIEYLESRGSHVYVDVGPAGTFANFVKYCTHRRTDSRAHALLTPLGRDRETLAAVLAAVR
jgi:acyl transferase domain-containing protein